METGNGSDKTEAEPVAWSAAAPSQPVKAPEDVLAFIVGNSGPIIGDRKDGAAIILTDLHDHSTGLMAMFDGVVDEIGHGVEQEVPITYDEDSSIHDSMEMRTLVLRGGIEQLHDFARDFC
jgi:hypothetical protein